jgi:hypothetical protein
MFNNYSVTQLLSKLAFLKYGLEKKPQQWPLKSLKRILLLEVYYIPLGCWQSVSKLHYKGLLTLSSIIEPRGSVVSSLHSYFGDPGLKS